MSKFTVTIEADSLPELADRVLALAGQLSATRDPVMPEVKVQTKPGKAPKTADAPKATGEAGESDAASTSEQDTSSSTSTTSSTATQSASPSEDKPAPQKEPEVKAAEAAAGEAPSIRDLVLQLVGMGRRDKVEGILSEFGLKRATEVDDARKDEMITALTDALA